MGDDGEAKTCGGGVTYRTPAGVVERIDTFQYRRLLVTGALHLVVALNVSWQANDVVATAGTASNTITTM